MMEAGFCHPTYLQNPIVLELEGTKQQETNRSSTGSLQPPSPTPKPNAGSPRSSPGPLPGHSQHTSQHSCCFLTTIPSCFSDLCMQICTQAGASRAHPSLAGIFDSGSAVPVFDVEASIRLIASLQKQSPSGLEQLLSGKDSNEWGFTGIVFGC